MSPEDADEQLLREAEIEPDGEEQSRFIDTDLSAFDFGDEVPTA